jgi:hypothetical protein
MSTEQEYVGNLVVGEAVKMEDQTTVAPDVAQAMQQVSADWDAIRKQEREKFIQDHKVELTDDDVTIFKKPRSGCKWCHGRGIEGFYAADSVRMPLQPAICRCLTNRLSLRGELPDPTERMSYGEFKDMMAQARKRYNLKEPENEQDTENATDTVQSDVQTGGEGRD